MGRDLNLTRTQKKKFSFKELTARKKIFFILLCIVFPIMLGISGIILANHRNWPLSPVALQFATIITILSADGYAVTIIIAIIYENKESIHETDVIKYHQKRLLKAPLLSLWLWFFYLLFFLNFLLFSSTSSERDIYAVIADPTNKIYIESYFIYMGILFEFFCVFILIRLSRVAKLKKEMIKLSITRDAHDLNEYLRARTRSSYYPFIILCALSIISAVGILIWNTLIVSIIVLISLFLLPFLIGIVDKIKHD
ncbi:MAG: hypothetical protein Q6373_017170 [Candidatus Sigynarchaeota archaeon]